MKNLVFLFSFVVCATISFRLSAQKVEDIIASYTEAMGGKDKWAEQTNSRSAVHVNIGGQFEFDATVTTASPTKSFFEANIQGKRIVEAFDGTTAWSINPFQTGDKPVKKTPEESREQLENEYPDGLMFYKERGHKVELLGEEEIEGAKCHKIKLTHAVTGGESIHFIDKESFALIMVRSFPQSGEMKGMTNETFFSDYTEMGGIMTATSMVQKVNGQAYMTITIKSVERNVTLDEKIFAFPAQ